ncbi:MAG TPA: class I SAM-dependent methyltransferase [Bacteroidetes bacterium]|nr:class I SAM-dependent methyltransferase [Bacteroidota bacterium]
MPRRFVTLPWLAALLALVLLWALAALWLAGRYGPAGVILAAAAALFILLVLALEAVLRLVDLSRRDVSDQRQLHELLSLHATLRPEMPLPVMREYAISPGLGVWYLRLLLAAAPKTVVELGSGASTLIAALALRRVGGGKVIALDHEPKYAEETRGWLEEHGVAEWAEVRVAPLKPMELAGRTFRWYDHEAVADLESIDVLLIDGPPSPEERTRRLPGLELLGPRITPGGVILVDDTHRKVWREAVLRWAEKQGFEVESSPAGVKAYLVLRRPA